MLIESKREECLDYSLKKIDKMQNKVHAAQADSGMISGLVIFLWGDHLMAASKAKLINAHTNV